MLGSKMSKCVSLSVFFAVFCLGVGLSSSCSQKTFEDSTKSCVNKFFSALKENAKQDCRALYAKLKTCIQNVVDECRNKTDDKNFSRIVSRYDVIIASPEYYCQDGMLKTFKGYNSLPDCQKRALKKVKKCVASFHGKFRENRGGQSLCRKYTKAKQCVQKTLKEFCKKTKRLRSLLRLYQDQYNPYCPGMVDRKKPPTRGSPSKPLGSCSERDYLILSRMCLASFVRTVQKDPKTPCRSVFMNKLHNCAKDIALHCHKHDSDYAKKRIERSFAQKSYIAYQQQKFCNGINFKMSYPPGILKGNQCKRIYNAKKEKCEASYIATYKKNKADSTLCRKYAEAKSCVKNATLVLCKVTPRLRDEITFIYDGFNPFCFNLKDPPIAKESRKFGDRVQRDTGPNQPSYPVEGSSIFPTGGGEKSLSIKNLGLVVVLSVLVLMGTVL